jgi:hypothetical protein
MKRQSQEMTWVQGLGSFATAAVLMLFVPVAILAVVAPLALAVRGVLEVALWLFGLQG